MAGEIQRFEPTPFEEQPSHDLAAEAWVLSAMMQRGGALAVELAAEILTPADFYRTQHGVIFAVLVEMYGAGEVITPVTLKGWLERENLLHQATGSRGPQYLADLFALPAVPEQAASHARIVWERSVRRQIDETGMRMSQLSRSYAEGPEEIIAAAQAHLGALAEGAQRDDGGAVTTAAFCARDSTRYAPLIPGLLDHQDRVVVVGEEGAGKTTLAYQVAYGLASTLTPIDAGRVLIIDLENPGGILQRRLSDMAHVAARSPRWSETNLYIYHRPGGMNLERADEAFRLAEIVRRANPDLIVAGPIYKMINEREKSDHQHAVVTRLFDVLRERMGCAVWLETHAPIVRTQGRRDLRPRGSGIWSYWPEFGIALAAGRKAGNIYVDLGRFRGDREEGRTWPARLTRNILPRPCWPWTAVWAEGTFLDPLPVEG
jgi:replicative DNA helicase